MEKTDIKSLTLKELQEEMQKLNEKPFRAKQIYEWMHVKLVPGYGDMTNIPQKLKDKLVENSKYLEATIPIIIDGIKDTYSASQLHNGKVLVIKA